MPKILMKIFALGSCYQIKYLYFVLSYAKKKWVELFNYAFIILRYKQEKHAGIWNKATEGSPLKSVQLKVIILLFPDSEEVYI